ncbi:MAG: peptidoglycan DD-metalloendopeptidase family protein [Alphaproteobacteria bacterium]|nr:peptidoglycan DD-metalloendopeptidase family protein [Alphaproteobacteria bacterium]MDE2014251.1 peptidoglycan DD-metalloendopeptidase family protein [Alphaproteobacteria bacterium]MDE2074224.1 peptidoglycan DD-metalloendopeptidase family protein [Alphaproteobacteria bacterium]MDE2352244.1 peptidoglycan DD-metalloendopeptidase family protein [Alphaproteobacteria bacterium]
MSFPRAFSVVLAAVLMAASAVPSALARAHHHPTTPKPRPQTEAAVPAQARPGLTVIPDMSKAVPASEIGKLPTTEDRYRTLQGQIGKAKPAVDAAKSKSDTLAAQAAALRARLIDTAARVQNLEQQKVDLGNQIVTLSAQEAVLAQSFAHDRVAVAHLLGILERLQHDTPPVIALRADDAMGAAEGAMLLGASLPRVYGAAADLARRLDALRQTRAQLIMRRAEAAKNAIQLAAARSALDQLLATKQAEADSATARYTTLEAALDKIAKEAGDLGQLLKKVAALRAEKPTRGDLAVVGPGENPGKGLAPDALERPVVGQIEDGGIDGVGGARAPGVTFVTQAGAQVVAPADAEVLFAGPYHRTGQVLILEMPGGYDLVLAGLDRVDVKVGDRLLAGEPLGVMPRSRTGARLYFELRRGGKGTSPAPWLRTGLRKAERS